MNLFSILNNFLIFDIFVLILVQIEGNFIKFKIFFDFYVSDKKNSHCRVRRCREQRPIYAI